MKFVICFAALTFVSGFAHADCASSHTQSACEAPVVTSGKAVVDGGSSVDAVNMTKSCSWGSDSCAQTDDGSNVICYAKYKASFDICSENDLTPSHKVQFTANDTGKSVSHVVADKPDKAHASDVDESEDKKPNTSGDKPHPKASARNGDQRGGKGGGKSPKNQVPGHLVKDGAPAPQGTPVYGQDGDNQDSSNQNSLFQPRGGNLGQPGSNGGR